MEVPKSLDSFRWTKHSFTGDAPTPRSSHSSTLVGDTLVVYGGYGNGVERGDFYHFNINSFESTFVAPLDKSSKIVRIGHTAQAVGDQIYVFGGWNGKKYLNYGFLYSVDKMNMLLEKNKDRIVPSARRDHTITLVNNKMFLFGGWNCVEQFNDLWILNDGWMWSKATAEGEAPIPRRGHTASVIGRQIYILGGIYGFSRYLSDLHILDTKSMTWTTPETSGEKPSPRAWHSANVCGKFIVVFGGTSGRLSFFNDVYVLDTEKLHWYKIQVPGEQPAPRCSHTSTLSGSKLIVFGGITSLSATVDRKITPLGDIFVLETGLTQDSNNS